MDFEYKLKGNDLNEGFNEARRSLFNLNGNASDCVNFKNRKFSMEI